VSVWGPSGRRLVRLDDDEPGTGHAGHARPQATPQLFDQQNKPRTQAARSEAKRSDRLAQAAQKGSQTNPTNLHIKAVEHPRKGMQNAKAVR
jgi:hypothetical protein